MIRDSDYSFFETCKWKPTENLCKPADFRQILQVTCGLKSWGWMLLWDQGVRIQLFDSITTLGLRTKFWVVSPYAMRGQL